MLYVSAFIFYGVQWLVRFKYFSGEGRTGPPGKRLSLQAVASIKVSTWGNVCLFSTSIFSENSVVAMAAHAEQRKGPTGVVEIRRWRNSDGRNVQVFRRLLSPPGQSWREARD